MKLITTGVDVAPMLAELDAQPELWDQNPDRRLRYGTAHGEMTDIWLRARARSEIDRQEAFNEPYWPVFYPAWTLLPSMHQVVWGLMAITRAVQLGGVLITRIPSGGRIQPHTDRGWHAEFFRTKFYVVLRGGPRCLNHEAGDVVNMRPGEVWQFLNTVEHGVENHDESERISLIIALRAEADEAR